MIYHNKIYYIFIIIYTIFILYILYNMYISLHNNNSIHILYIMCYIYHLFYFMYMNVLHACKSVPYVCAYVCRDQKSVSDALKLELRAVVSSHIDAGNQTQVF